MVVKNKISVNAPELTQVRLIIGGMADNVPWSEGTAAMELQLSKQMTAVKQEQGHGQDKSEEKALSAARYGGGVGGHGYSGDRRKRQDRSDSEESNKSKHVALNRDHKICWDYQKGACNRGSYCRFSHEVPRKSGTREGKEGGRSTSSGDNRGKAKRQESDSSGSEASRRHDTPKKKKGGYGKDKYVK